MPRFISISSSNFQSENINDFARDAVSQAVLDSSARLEVTWSFEVRQAMNRPRSTEKKTLAFDLVTKLKMHFDSKEPMWCTSNINSFKKETQRHFVRRKMESEQRASLRTLQSGSQQRDLFFRRHDISAITVTDPSRLRCSPGKKLNV